MLPPKIFKTIKQPYGSRLCGVCVAAMAVGKGLRYTLNRIGTIKHQDGQSYARTRDMLEFLGGHGIHWGMTMAVSDGSLLRSDREELIPFRLAGWPSICTVPSQVLEGGLHYVFWDGEVIRDPSPSVGDEAPLDSYSAGMVDIVPLTYLDERPRCDGRPSCEV